MPFSPLGAGFLTGKIGATTEFGSTDFRNMSPRFTPEARAANEVKLTPGDLQEIEDAAAKITIQGAVFLKQS